MVDWKMIEMNPVNIFRKMANLNYFFQQVKSLHLDFVSIGSRDILDGSKNKILALIWSFMRHHYIHQFKVSQINEEKIQEWADNFIQTDLQPT